MEEQFAGMGLQEVRELRSLRHASIQITVDTYGHLIPGANRAAVDKLDDVPAQPTATPAQPEAVSSGQSR